MESSGMGAAIEVKPLEHVEVFGEMEERAKANEPAGLKVHIRACGTDPKACANAVAEALEVFGRANPKRA